jgi:serine/threonine protein kinase
MSQRFIRCPHCSMPHDVLQVFCPSTGKAIRRDKRDKHSEPPPRAAAPREKPAEWPPRAPPKRDLLGKTIGGKYVVRSVLGEGGMGTVFEAEHLTIGRSVAVKVLHPNQARKKDAVRRFHQEARAAGAIGHPNICEVYDLGTLEDGSPYLVMEKLVGETLAERIAAEGGLPFEDVIDILTQVLSGLVAAHEKSIVHRDIKPENVFLTRRVGCPPVCKLLDFGVSKMIAPLIGAKEEDLDLTRTGMVMGTPYYMSPEQARGDRNLDARVDLYACGVILYEALTGKRPFTAANYNALLLQILSSKPRPARELRPALPAGFDGVLDKAMSRSRDDRYRSATDFQKDLQTLRDRHNAGGAAGPGAAFRQAPKPVLPFSHPVTQRGAAPPPLPPRPSPSVQRHELTPSSVEIPIIVSGDTPLSGENMPVEATELEARRAPTPAPPDATRAASDAREFEEYPTEVQSSPFDELKPEDQTTTQRRAHDLNQGLGRAKRSIRDTDTAVRPPTIRDTDATGRPAMLRDRRSQPAGEGDLPDDQETIIRPSAAFPMQRRRPRKPPSPDDTIKVDSDAASMEGDPTQLMTPRAPKVPRR